MRIRLLAPLTAVLVSGAVGLAAAPAQAAPAAAPAAVAPAAQPGGSLVQDVTGTINGAAASGTLTVTKFVRQGSQLLAVGTLNLSNTTSTLTQQVQVPVDLVGSNGSCTILHLVLGPLDLNLLGLMVHLDQVTLDISAQPGPGNLLGNLLCAVAGLLDGPNPLGGLAGLLNQILGAL